MTVLGRESAQGVATSRAKQYLAGSAFVAAGIVLGLGLSQVIELDDATTFTGSMVERSVAMERNVDALVEGGRAQVVQMTEMLYQWEYPMVERSLAMERNISVLIESGQAQVAASAGDK